MRIHRSKYRSWSGVLLVGWMMLLAFEGKAQQDPMFSQYYFNPLTVNPAYAGSRDVVSLTGLVRRQWLGIASAPVTGGFSIHTPDAARKNGFGLTIVNDQLSYIGQTWLSGAYSYRIPMGKYKLQLGLQGTLYNWRINWNKAHMIDPNDNVPAMYGRNLLLPNAGFGAFFYGEKLFAGLSIPHLLVNSLDNNRPGISLNSKESDIAALKRHFFLMAGYVIPIDPDFKIKPSVLLKQVYGAPLELDINMNMYFGGKFGVGASYRTGDGIVGILEYQFNRQLRAGYAYDYPFTDLRRFTSGSHELMISYDFSFGNESVVSPRVF
ncbi:MAG: type IX secretion system membrane protein PorP/SprF [Bacteroidetes bacterium]|nr:type IX secretion system membrane protein PorP/SprF [Bacteroidota bacterium]